METESESESVNIDQTKAMKSESESVNMDQTKRHLFNTAMKGEWDEVINICKKDQRLHKVKITKSGGTALHIAVSNGREEVVKDLVTIIKAKKELDPLKVTDERDNTPLHIAAAQGSVNMCNVIATADKKLIGARNNNGETPLFLAALQGHKGAFLCLHFIGDSEDDRHTYSRRKDGETILHCAISGDYFDLAFQIIHLYEDLVNSVNEQGVSPLHLLATKPNAFRSGSHLGRCKKIIYHCIFVNKLQKEKSYEQYQLKTDEKKMNYPKNYETCFNFVTMVHKTVKVLTDKSGTIQKRDPENPEKSKGADRTGDQVTDKGGTTKKEQQQPRDPENPKGSKDSERTGVQEEELSRTIGAQVYQLFPQNYGICFEFVKLVSKAILVILGFGSTKIKKIREKKEKHTWSVQILDELLKHAILYEYEDDGRKPLHQPSSLEEDETSPYEIVEGGDVAFSRDNQASVTSPTDPKAVPDTNTGEKESNSPETSVLITAKNGKTEIVEKISELFPVAIREMNSEKKNVVLLEMENRQTQSYKSTIPETPILIAAKNGITEIVEKILELFPVAIHDMNSEKKNIVLLAVENRQPHVYQLLLKTTVMKESVFRKVDINGNSALHLAATLGEHKPWLIPGAALQMQWEIKWYEYVKQSMPLHFFVRYNKQNKSPKDVFTETHKELVEAGGQWLTNTSESCSVVAALIATVAFTTSTAVPGGVKEESGEPTFEDQPAFNVFATSSLVALSFSVTSVVMFLSVLTSRYQERDFGKDLPRKLLLGLTSLFVSIASILISFCAGHFFVLRDQLKYTALPVYAVTGLPVTFFAIAQFPLYFDLIWATFKKVPQRSYKSIPM